MSAHTAAAAGLVSVSISPPGRGWTPEEVAERFVSRLVSVADTAPQPLRDQARAFQQEMRVMAAYYMREAIKSDRTTLIHKLREAGLHDAAAVIQKGF